MAVQINWGLARTPDFTGNAIQALQQGQQQGRQQATQSALRQYATDPEGSINALMSVDPVAASQLRQVHVQDQADQRAQTFRDAISKGDMDAATKAAAGDPTLMKGLSDFRANAVQTSQIVAGKLGALKAVPPEQRQAYLQNNIAPDLQAMGLPVQKLAGLDLSDAGIDAAMRQQLSLADQVKQDNSNRDFGLKKDQFGETVRHDTATEGQQASTLAETSRHNQQSERTAVLTANAATSNAATNAKKLQLMANGGGMDPDVIEFYAQRNATDGYLPNMGMGAAGAGLKAAILARSAQLQRGAGGTGADMAANVAGAKANTAALGDQAKKSAVISAAEQTANATGDLALQLAQQGGAGPGQKWFNKPVQQIRTQLSDPQAAAFNNALGTFRDEYAKVVGGGQVTDKLRGDIDSRINGAMSIGELQKVISTMKQEMQYRTQSQNAGQATLKGNIRTGGLGSPAPAASAGRPSLDSIFGKH